MLSFDIFQGSQREHNETIGTLLGFPFPLFPQTWNILCKYMNAGAWLCMLDFEYVLADYFYGHFKSDIVMTKQQFEDNLAEQVRSYK